MCESQVTEIDKVDNINRTTKGTKPHQNLGKDQEISFKEQTLNQKDRNRKEQRAASVIGVVAVILTKTSVQQQIKHVTSVIKLVTLQNVADQRTDH